MFYVYERDFSGNCHAWIAGDVSRLCEYAHDRARALGMEVNLLTAPDEVPAALRNMFAVFHVYNGSAEARGGIERGEVCAWGRAFFERWITRQDSMQARDQRKSMVPQ